MSVRGTGKRREGKGRKQHESGKGTPALDKVQLLRINFN